MKAYGPFTRYVVAVSNHAGSPCIDYHEFDDFDDAKEFYEETINQPHIEDVCIYEHKSI